MGRGYRFHETIYHEGLNLQKTIGANSRSELRYKIEIQKNQWNERWNRKLESDNKKRIDEQKRAEKAEIAKNNEKAVLYAEQLSKDAATLQDHLDSLIIDDLNFSMIDFESLKTHLDYSVPYPSQPIMIPDEREPQRSDEIFNPKPGLLVKISKNKMVQFNEQNDANFKIAHDAWVQKDQNNKANNSKMMMEYQQKIADLH